MAVYINGILAEHYSKENPSPFAIPKQLIDGLNKAIAIETGIKEELIEIINKAKEVHTNFNKELLNSISISNEILIKAGAVMKEIQDKTPVSLKILANYGWYIPFNSIPSEIFGYAQALRQGYVDFVDDKLTEIFESDLKVIIRRLCKEFPDREKILLEAKEAHLKRRYFSSISLFLSTADGIVDGKLFKADALKRYFKRSGITGNIFNDFLTEKDAIKADFDRDKGKFGSSFSRHGVLHGRDVEYGTRINSLKALSLLDYIATFVIGIRNK